MKKCLLRCAVLTLLALFMLTPALANSWGLTGDLLNVVMADERWDDYSTIAKQQGDFAVMGGRYHNVLMRHKDGKLLTYPLAVYQHTDDRAKKVKLNLRPDDQLLTLLYGEDETYTFRLDHQFDVYYIDDALVFAQIGELTFNRDGYGFTVSDGRSIALWQNNVVLDHFNIQLFPRSVEEVLHLNSMYAALDSADRLGTDLNGLLCSGSGKGTAPVYSAPYGASAWRASKGKAAVGLSGKYWQLGTYVNADGEAYNKIRYEVSERTQRIGYVPAQDLKAEPGEDQTMQMIRVPLEARSDTWLTDDPVVSQYQQFYVPPGTQLTCMGLYGSDYAYVAGKIKNGSFTDGGKPVTEGDQTVWGYVPLRDLMISSADPKRNTIEWDTMAKFAGQWHFASGGLGITDVLMLYADGTWEGYTDVLTGGTWKLTRYDPADNLYWSQVPYEITFSQENGAVSIHGFQPDENGDSFSLLYWEGGGAYERLEGTFSPPAEGTNG